MSAKIYVGSVCVFVPVIAVTSPQGGNLSWNTTDDSLRGAFGEYGNVVDCIVMRDRDTGRSRGFGFVTFGSQDEAQNAINGMHEQDLDGRRIKVNLANARTGGGGGGGYQGGGGYGGGGGGYQGGGGSYGGGGYQGGGGYGGGYQQGGGGGGYGGGY